MTNEEIAMAIRAGQASYNQLWEQVHKYIRQQAGQFSRQYSDLCHGAGVEPDDLVQCGFLALYDAVQAYKPDSGHSLIAFLAHPLRNRFREVCGIRSTKRDSLNGCDSLDREITGDDGDTITLEELQEDRQAAVDMESAIDHAYQVELHGALEKALDTLPELQGEVLRRLYWHGQTQAAIAADHGLTGEQIRQHKVKALRALRKPSVARSLQSFYEEVLDTAAWHGTGWKSWNPSGASSVERAIEKAEDLTHKQ